MNHSDIVGLGAILMSLTACGAPDQGSTGVPETEELGEITEAFGEAACGAVFPDDFIPQTSHDAVTSLDANYDHPPGCPHQYVVWKTIDGLPATTVVAAAKYAGAVGGAYVCEGAWVQVALWRKSPSTSTYVKVAQSPLVTGKVRNGQCQVPTAIAYVDQDYTNIHYKAVAQAGWTLAYTQVSVSIERAQ